MRSERPRKECNSLVPSFLFSLLLFLLCSLEEKMDEPLFLLYIYAILGYGFAWQSPAYAPLLARPSRSLFSLIFCPEDATRSRVASAPSLKIPLLARSRTRYVLTTFTGHSILTSNPI